MNTILLQVQKYLDSVSKNPVKVDDKLVQEFVGRVKTPC